MTEVVAIRSTLRTKVPVLPYEKIARAVLGARYELSLVICGDSLAKRMNIEYRPTSPRLRRTKKKSYSPNVLSFPLSKTEGEIFLNVRKAEREARLFGVSTRERLALLFVHGCYHLRGLQHGRTMEGKERDTLRAFSFSWHGNSTRA